MKISSYSLVALLVLLGLTAPVQAKDQGAPYFDPASIDLKTLLPDPPAVGSDATTKEIELILQKQSTRTPEDVARIKSEVKLNMWCFANVLGPWYTKAKLPATVALFDRVDIGDEHPIVESAKKFWARPRPPKQNSQVHPPIELPTNDSYPSGHSTFGTVTALILAELVPDQKDALIARGEQIGDDRVLAGVHFPSDVAADARWGRRSSPS